jgi:methionyl-tRNA formyltransferase
MRIAVCCATRRGLLVLRRLAELAPHDELVVFSFREEPHEPPFFDAIRAEADAHGAAFHEGRQLGGARLRQVWEQAAIDLAFAVSWRYLIPPEVFGRPRLGTYVIHDSLLPEYRGFAPTVWALVNGEDHTGATLFEMARDVDSGDVIDQRPVPIGPDDAIADVMQRVTGAYLELLTDNLDALRSGTAPRRPQDAARATYTCKRLPEDNRIDWKAPARCVHDLVRAVSSPYPGAFTTLGGERLTVWAASRVEGRRYAGRTPGRVAEVRPGEGAVVLAGDGPVLLRQVQREGGLPVCAAEVLDRVSLTLGT